MSLFLSLCAEMANVTWRGTLLVALIFALRPLLTRWLPLKIMPWLWLVLASKLLFITAPAGWWSLYNLLAIGDRFHPEPLQTPFDLPTTGLPSGLERLASASAAHPPGNWTTIPGLIWLSGVLLLALGQIGTNISFHLRLRREGNPSDVPWQHLLSESAELAGLKRVPRLLQTHLVASPSLVGLFRPCLLVPCHFFDQLEPKEIRWVFLHELAHQRRCDLWLLTLFAAARTVHWFNPFVWLAERALRADCEAACDAEVLRRVSGLPHDYGDTLLRLTRLTALHAGMPVLFSAISLHATPTERRLRMILRYRQPNLWKSLAGVAVIVTIGLLTLSNEGVAQENALAVPVRAGSNTPNDQARIAALKSKLKSIVFEKVDFNHADISTVLQFLEIKSNQLDPDKEVNFVLRLPDQITSSSGMNQRVQASFPTITLQATHISLGDVLDQLASQAHLLYAVEPYAIYLKTGRPQ